MPFDATLNLLVDFPVVSCGCANCGDTAGEVVDIDVEVKLGIHFNAPDESPDTFPMAGNGKRLKLNSGNRNWFDRMAEEYREATWNSAMESNAGI